MAELQEGFLDKLKTAIKTSTAGAKARAAGDWFREKAGQAGASARMRAVTPNQLFRRQPEDSIMLGKMFFYEQRNVWNEETHCQDLQHLKDILVMPFFLRIE